MDDDNTLRTATMKVAYVGMDEYNGGFSWPQTKNENYNTFEDNRKHQKASTNRPANKKRLNGLYVKDSKNGELRFLASNSQINQVINQKQEFLEQLRPTTTTGTGNGVNPIIINTATVGATATATGTGTGTGTATTPVTTTGTTGGTAVGGGGAANNNIPPSPIADLLPQIVAQAALTRRRPGNNRRRVVNNRRRVVNNRRRRPARRGTKKGPQIFVVRAGN
ncbi:uncharacterized protein LOC133335775 [Musca vetustissima]|uniref:uncharacterized protein LOC133335775 n=1 Tax=Musca vetustissima TaxID=27455 RepID=UPI002AB76435|nr:uncharacterized protein LOC133335775 [Musca vetustissima]